MSTKYWSSSDTLCFLLWAFEHLGFGKGDVTGGQPFFPGSPRGFSPHRTDEKNTINKLHTSCFPHFHYPFLVFVFFSSGLSLILFLRLQPNTRSSFRVFDTHRIPARQSFGTALGGRWCRERLDIEKTRSGSVSSQCSVWAGAAAVWSSGVVWRITGVCRDGFSHLGLDADDERLPLNS